MKADLIGVPLLLDLSETMVATLLAAPFDANSIGIARTAWAKSKGVEATFTNSAGMKLTLIPPGMFQMGSPKEETDHKDNEQLHEVEITRPFFMGIHEVTQAQYERVMGENQSRFSRHGEGKDKVAGIDPSNFPVESVSWDDAQDFIRRLNTDSAEQRAGRRYRLPSEATRAFDANLRMFSFEVIITHSILFRVDLLRHVI